MIDARRIETINDVELVLESPRASFNELQDCVEIATTEGRWDLTKAAAERSLDESLQAPGSQTLQMEWALDVIVSTRLKRPSTIEELPSAIEGLMDWLQKLRTRVASSHPVIEMKIKEDNLAAVLVLLANPEPVAQIQLCSKLRKLERPDLAEIAASRAIDGGGERGIALTTRGAAKSDQKKYREAITDLEEALRLDGANYHALTSISRAYQELGDLDTALKTVEHALEIDPHNTYAVHRLLSLAVKSNDFDALEEARRKLAAVGFASNPEAHRLIDLYVAEALFEEERFEESRKMLTLVMQEPSAGELAKRMLRLKSKLRKVGSGRQDALDL